MRVLEGWDAFIADELARRDETQLLRRLRAFARDGAWLIADDGRRLLDLSSNDYLGLASHPVLREAAARAASTRAGATAARLIAGTDRAVIALEAKLAEFQQCEAALVFGSGYLANVGVLTALLGPDDAVFSDQLNHASIIDGCRLSRATIYRYPHGDIGELEAMLARADQQGVRRKLIATESVFSMDGNVAPLNDIVELKERFGALLVVDEAHADGVFGMHGEGYAHELGVGGGVDLHVGTFGKAFGAYGAYVAGNRQLIDYFLNAARSFVFTTALPPPVIASIDAALDLIRDAGDLRDEVRRKAARFRERLAGLGVDTAGSTTQIVPIIIGDSAAALALARELEENGVLAMAIRPPTVPPGTARLRCSLSAHQPDSDLEHALSAIEAALAGDR